VKAVLRGGEAERGDGVVRSSIAALGDSRNRKNPFRRDADQRSNLIIAHAARGQMGTECPKEGHQADFREM
jgi:hypothetical protein